MPEYTQETAFLHILRINNDCAKRVNTWGKPKKVHFVEGKMASQIDSFALVDCLDVINRS